MPGHCQSINGRTANREEVEPLVPLVAPFAPHLAEELWEKLGHDGSIFEGASWPAYDPAKTIAETVEFIVQVNGKLRGRMPLPRGIGENAAAAAALADPNVRQFTEGGRIAKTIFVAYRLINFVVGKSSA